MGERADLVRRMLELFIANDPEAWELWSEAASATIPEDWIEPGPFDSREQIRDFWGSFEQAFGRDWTQGLSILAVEERADGGVLATMSMATTGSHSGVALPADDVSAIYTVEHGLISHCDYSRTGIPM